MTGAYELAPRPPNLLRQRIVLDITRVLEHS
jgi:hypothetical protein